MFRHEQLVPQGAWKDASSLVVRSGWNHLMYAKPSARTPEKLYAGKVETTVATMMLDVLGVSAGDIIDKQAFFRALTAFNLKWRANDEVLDELRQDLGPVTPEELETTPVYHKYADAMVTGAKGTRIALESARQLIPGRDLRSRARLGRIEGLMEDYTKKVADTANNPTYKVGEMLPYDIALACKEDITAFLGRTVVSFTQVLLNLPENQRAAEFFGALGTACQIGDDYLDWRKDWLDRNKRQITSSEPVRPGENLVNSTIFEYPEEKRACEGVLTDKAKKSADWLAEVAPATTQTVLHRFQTLIDRLPTYPQGEKATGIAAFSFYNLIPKAPEDNWFSRWAKY